MKILSAIWFPVYRKSLFLGIVCIENEEEVYLPGIIPKRSVKVLPITRDMKDTDSNELVAKVGNSMKFDQARGFFPELITFDNFKHE